MAATQLFHDPTMVAGYAQDAPRKVPGLADLHRMAILLLAECARPNAHVLVLGAGGGLELKAFADAQPHWHLHGVDPSAAMLDIARQVLAPLPDRIDLQQGYIEDAPQTAFDGATCLLTLHFLEPAERLRVLQQLRLRLKPGAPLVVAHHSQPPGADPHRWMTFSAAFAIPTIDFPAAAASAETMVARLPLLSMAEEEALLREAGFADVALFYAGFSFRGWVAYAAGDAAVTM
ncbi:methyltransferase domain-containing protein [Altererythrobacter xixiisoli]|uniref:Methyltransferase domain-containing protein n=1 Tax=Croceibacterium xixiisoli TaxID=1476466 RepID=A0A6I4TTR1_9SPHN|nr:class I SAM-dependent methyltransferase [Croceibacterium xixiisoli]MXO98257.1 methyltransferase domain-containing protein [Croceibacterium xixiisoli]